MNIYEEAKNNHLQNRKVVLIVNLGSPDSLSVNSIKNFLKNFLTDKMVIKIPKIFWYPILFGIILPFRSKKLLKLYQQIWIEGCSPLAYFTKKQAQLLDIELEDFTVRYAFSYSSPTIQEELTNLHAKYNISSLIVLPLYPQFSSTTTLPVFDAVYKFYQNKFYIPELRFIHDFYQNELYIKSLVATIKESWNKNGQNDVLVFSFHGLPESIIKNGDCYFDQCIGTARLVTQSLGLKEDQYVIAFQSKFGKQKWLSPSTINTLENLAASGIQSVDIICPGFVSDCLETLEEIQITNKEVYINAGGKKYNYIQCLNDSMNFIQVLKSLI